MLPGAESPGVRILQVDERCATDPGYGVHWTSEWLVGSVPGLARGQGALEATGVLDADVALLEISDRPRPAVMPLVEHLRAQGVPVAIRIHRAFRGRESAPGPVGTDPLGEVLQAVIDASDIAFFGGRGELVRVASELNVAPHKPSLIPSPIQLPAGLKGVPGAGAIGIGFGEGGLPGGVRPVPSMAVLHREIRSCSAVALGPGFGPGHPALSRGLIDCGIGVVAPRAQAALDGFAVPGWKSVSPGADAGEWSRALASHGDIEPTRLPRNDTALKRWFDCLRGLSKRELLTSGA